MSLELDPAALQEVRQETFNMVASLRAYFEREKLPCSLILICGETVVTHTEDRNGN